MTETLAQTYYKIDPPYKSRTVQDSTVFGESCLMQLVKDLESTASIAYDKISESANKLFYGGEKNINSQISMLIDMYGFRRASEVYSFLKDNNYLTPIVSRAYLKIREQFPSENIFLEIYSNPAYPTEEQVVISILTSRSPEKAIERLDKVDDEWWLGNSNEPYINICLKLEYQ